jgi:hypothetical protein
MNEKSEQDGLKNVGGAVRADAAGVADLHADVAQDLRLVGADQGGGRLLVPAARAADQLVKGRGVAHGRLLSGRFLGMFGNWWLRL